MPSSNSGFQRLPQAALSRSRFLRLAAGALLPVVGWRLPAAAAANPQLAQNSGAIGTKDAAVDLSERPDTGGRCHHVGAFDEAIGRSEFSAPPISIWLNRGRRSARKRKRDG